MFVLKARSSISLLRLLVFGLSLTFLGYVLDSLDFLDFLVPGYVEVIAFCSLYYPWTMQVGLKGVRFSSVFGRKLPPFLPFRLEESDESAKIGSLPVTTVYFANVALMICVEALLSFLGANISNGFIVALCAFALCARVVSPLWLGFKTRGRYLALITVAGLFLACEFFILMGGSTPSLERVRSYVPLVTAAAVFSEIVNVKGDFCVMRKSPLMRIIMGLAISVVLLLPVLSNFPWMLSGPCSYGLTSVLVGYALTFRNTSRNSVR